jgi:plasmid stabilization system protein ParE
MSARSRRRLTIEERARLDIEDALLYTQERWGKDQRRRYRAQITKATRSLLDYPERGRPRAAQQPGHRGQGHSVSSRQVGRYPRPGVQVHSCQTKRNAYELGACARTPVGVCHVARVPVRRPIRV